MRLPNRLPQYPYGDNEHLYFGWGNDASMYWDGTNLLINSGADIRMAVAAGEDVILYDGTTQMLNIDYAANITTIVGGAVAGDDIWLKANATDAYPYIDLAGNSAIKYVAVGQHDWNIAAVHIARLKTTGGGGSFHLKESTTPAAIASYGAIYTKADNKLYFQDGAGIEYTVTIV